MIALGSGTYEIMWNATVTLACPMEDSTTSNNIRDCYAQAEEEAKLPPPLREEVWPIRPRKDERVMSQRNSRVMVKQGYFLHRQ